MNVRPQTGSSNSTHSRRVHKTYDCIVVGGGVIGLLSALELRQAGASVLLVERGKIGRESSWAGGGILAPIYPWDYPEPISLLAKWSQQQYIRLAKIIFAETGIDPEHTNSGLLINGTDAAAAAKNWARQFGYRLEIVDARQVQELAPNINPTAFPRSFWLPDICQVRNPRLLKGVTKLVRAAGVVVQEETEIQRILTEKGRVVGVAARARVLHAKSIVIACGAWSTKVLAGWSSAVRIRPIRGQILLLKCRPGFLTPILYSDRKYLIPRRDGRILVGSTLEDVGFRKQTTATAQRLLLRAAADMVPALADYPLEMHWAGLRPGTEHRLPYIGAIPGVTGLFVNSGHFRNGLLLAPASALLLRELVQGTATTFDPKPFAIRATAHA